MEHAPTGGRSYPLLLRTAGDVSAEWALWQSRPHVDLDRRAPVEASGVAG